MSNDDNLNMHISENDLNKLSSDPSVEHSILYYFTEPRWEKYSGYDASADLPELEDFLEAYSFSDKKIHPQKRAYPLVNLVDNYMFLTKELN